MSKKTYIRAEEGKPPGISVIYYDTDGNETIRYHDKNGKTGSHAWRNNNPGNLGWGSGDHARKQVVLGRLKNDLFFLTMLQGSNLCGSFLRKIFIND